MSMDFYVPIFMLIWKPLARIVGLTMRKAKNNVFGGTFVQLAKQFVDGIAKDIVGQRLVRFDNKHEAMHFGELVKH